MYIFLFTATATTEIYTLSLHDALPIFSTMKRLAFAIGGLFGAATVAPTLLVATASGRSSAGTTFHLVEKDQAFNRSEEHTSELQSHVNLVCRLLLEKKNKYITNKAAIR